MGTYVGVDWASRGWLAVTIDGNNPWKVDMHPSFHSVWFSNGGADQILVDIPTGLPDASRRACDRQAKEFLGSPGSRSVFWTPCRDAVYADSYVRAKEYNKDLVGKSISSQAWWFSPRIREVDEFLRDVPTAREKIRESHPEVCFKAISASEPGLNSKHDATGLEARLDALDGFEPGTAGQYERICEDQIDAHPVWSRRVGRSNRDDLLDAMALAVTAKRGNGDYARFPTDFSEDDVDPEGLPMEIVYSVP